MRVETWEVESGNVGSAASGLLTKRQSFRLKSVCGTLHYQLSTINFQLSTFNFQLSTFNSQLSTKYVVLRRKNKNVTE
ncbi:MAG: hypothetical protein LBE12_03690 [Planctomycetaceae bacterium]|nr:hypothetical protein [Planctomycetaceae bacterium]